MLKIDSLLSALKSGEIKELPYFSYIGLYPLYYITSYGNIICPECANKIINDDYEDIVNYDVNWEDDSLYCSHCSKRIKSAYGGDE